MTLGGQFNAEECHPSHKLTKQDVINIRSRYNNHKRKNKVYEDYYLTISNNGIDTPYFILTIFNSTVLPSTGNNVLGFTFGYPVIEIT